MQNFKDYNDKMGEFGVHDPAIIKDSGKYYTISTHGYYQFRVSYDLVNWIDEGLSCFNKSSIQQELKEGIEYCKVEVPSSRNEGSPFWAPDLIKFNGKYHLYYAISSFGSTQSYIGLATSDKLCGEYKHICAVHRSKAGEMSKPNAIDPCVKFDKNGKLFMSYGSYFGGIYIKELDNLTGSPKNINEIGTKIAGGNGAPIEGSYIIYNRKTKFYYLFVSYGGLVDSYNVRVGRSKNILGPYLDPSGKNLTDIDWDSTGGMIIGNYHFSHQKDTYTAPGHNSILEDDGKYYFIHHTRLNNDPSKHYLNVRSLFFNQNGWPVVMPNRYDLDKLYYSNKNISGIYNVIYFPKFTGAKTNQSKSVKIELGKNLNKHSKFIEFSNENEIFYGVMCLLFDEGLNSTTLGFSAMSENGETIYAIKIRD